MRRILTAIIFAMALSSISAWSATTVTEKKVGEKTFLEVANKWYRLTLDPARNGRITAWIPAGGPRNVAFEGLGVANFTRTDTGGGFEIPLLAETTTFPDRVELTLTNRPEEREVLTNVDVRKTFVFRETTPYIEVRIEIVNLGAGSLVGWRLYNDLAQSADKKGSAFLEAGPSKTKEEWADNNPALKKTWAIWDKPGSGWGGVDTGFEYTVVFHAAPENLHQVFSFAGDESAAYEMRFRDTIDKGETLVRTLLMAAIPAPDAKTALANLRSPECLLPGIAERIRGEVAARKSGDVVLDKRSDRILFVGRADRYIFYRTDAAARIPEFRGKSDFAPLNYNTMTADCLGFPLTAAGIARYRLIVFVDTPYSYLLPSSWELVEKFVNAGGTAVFVGDHAVGYEDTPIEKILPARFDYTKQQQGGGAAARQKVANDRTPYAPLEAGDPASILRTGMDLSSPPPVSVHQSVARKGAVVHLKAGRWPVLTSWKIGTGTVYSFPVCLTANYHIPYDVDQPEYEGSSVIPIKAEPPGERKKSIFFWNGYDELWTRIATLAARGDQAAARFRAMPVTPRDAQKIGAFSLTVGDYEGLCTVFRRGYAVPFSTKLSGKESGKLLLSLKDRRGTIVWKREIEPTTEPTGTIPLDGLAYGPYTVLASLGNQHEEKTLHILPDYESQDLFLITTLGSDVVSDDPLQQNEVLSRAKEAGLNLVMTTALWNPDLYRWPERHRREFADRVLLKEGLIPAHYDISVTGGGGTNANAHATDTVIRERIQKMLAQLTNKWAMAPRGVVTYIYDEPYHEACAQCAEEYVKKYGGPAPKTVTDPGWYRLNAIAIQVNVEGMKRAGALWKEMDTGHLTKNRWGITNEGGGLLGDAPTLARAFGGYGVDMFSSSPGNWQAQYAFDMALAACDGDPATLGFQIEADSFYGGTPIAAQRGQGTYNCLARGARLIQWYDWGWCRTKAELGIHPQRFACVKRATLEARKIGPVLTGMKRPRAEIAMLVPSAVQMMWMSGEARGRNDAALLAAYKAAQVSCGNVDFLYYQHLREGNLNGYDVLLLAGNDWMDEEILDIIRRWVESGKTLLVMPKSGFTNTDFKPTALFSTVCPVSFGAQKEGVAVKEIGNPAGVAYPVESAGGETICSYADNAPAAKLFKLGKGRVAVFGFVPLSATAMEEIFQTLKLSPSTARSSDQDSSAFVLKDGNAYYCVAVNSENKAKTTEIRMKTGFSSTPFACDMLTGKPCPFTMAADGTITIPVALEPFWGRAIAFLPDRPMKLAVTATGLRAGEAGSYRTTLTGADGKPLSGRVPVHLAVTDASGLARPEYGGYHVLKNGVFIHDVALGTNDPVGAWKIVARETWTGKTSTISFSVRR